MYACVCLEACVDQNCLPFDWPALVFLYPAVQNERQPRNTAQVRQDQIESELDHALTANSATVSATHPAFSPGANHRFMASLMSAETCAKLEPEDGGQSMYINNNNNNNNTHIHTHKHTHTNVYIFFSNVCIYVPNFFIFSSIPIYWQIYKSVDL